MAKRYSQPQGGARIDWANPITRGLYVGIDAPNNRYIGSSSKSLTQAVIDTKITPTGVAKKLGISGNAQSVFTSSSTTSITMLQIGVVGTNTAQSSPFTMSHNGASNTFAIEHSDGTTAGKIRGRVYIGGYQYCGGSVTLPAGSVYVAVLRHTHGVGQALWLNGKKDAVTTSATGSTLGNPYYGTYSSFSEFGVLNVVWNRALSDAEIKSLSENPWQLFHPTARPLWVPAAGGPVTHATSGDLTGSAATVAGTAARLRVMTSSGVLVGGGATLTGTAARAGGAVTHPSSGTLEGQGATLAGTAARTPAIVAHATSGALSGQGAALAGTAARVAAPVTHATSGTLTGDGATLSGMAQNGTIAPPIINSGGGGGSGARIKNRRELDDLLTRALKKPVEVAVQLLLPATPSSEAISTVIRAMEAREAAANKSVARQAQSLLARLQVLEREAEEEEAVVMMLLLD